MIRGRFAAVLFGAILLCPTPVHAQIPVPWLSGYYLNVPLWSNPSPFGAGGFGDVQRVRFMANPDPGPLSLDVAYEHAFSWSARSGGGLSPAVPGALAPSGGEWLDLQWVIEDTEHIQWSHRFDRLSISAGLTESLAATVGRQTISWATTLLLTPADPFKPFDPADPFREYRAGVDAGRLRFFPGPLSEAEVVVRPADFSIGETLSVLGRYTGVLSTWEISGYAGVLYDELAFSASGTGGVGSAALRGEVQFRDEGDRLVVRGTAGLDTRLGVLGRDLYLVLEYQHDGFGASSAAELEEVVQSAPFARGELQVLSADVFASQGDYQLHPLVSTQLLVLWSLNDLSALVSPGAAYSVSDNVTAQGGLFLGIGPDDTTPVDPLPSEFGVVPTALYLSVSFFF